MITLTPPQRSLLESSLYIATAGFLWNGRKIALMSPPTLQYGVLAISHVALSALVKHSIQEDKKEPPLDQMVGIVFASLTLMIASTHDQDTEPCRREQHSGLRRDCSHSATNHGDQEMHLH